MQQQTLCTIWYQILNTVYCQTKKASEQEGDVGMNIYDAVEAIMDIEITQFYPTTGHYKQAIADILQKFLDTNGVGEEYLEEKK